MDSIISHMERATILHEALTLRSVLITKRLATIKLVCTSSFRSPGGIIRNVKIRIKWMKITGLLNCATSSKREVWGWGRN